MLMTTTMTTKQKKDKYTKRMPYLNALTAASQLLSLVGRRPRQTRSATPYHHPSPNNKYKEQNKSKKNQQLQNVQS